MEDGWEYTSAVHLNSIACPQPDGAYPKPCAAARPYPTKTKYPNPLWPDPVTSDYDHDSVPTLEEFRAWKRHSTHSLTNMWYSDGLQSSVDDVLGDGCVGMTVTPLTLPADLGLAASWTMRPEYERMHDLRADNCLSDDERDEDADLLTNFDEIAGRMPAASWWASEYKEEGVYPDAPGGTQWLDRDTDGDGIADGIDDQDHDDFLNIEEIERGNRYMLEKRPRLAH
jgi:hypothetical protein